MMRGNRVILAVLLAVALHGCDGSQPRWPWRQKEVPVTDPTEIASPPAPATQPSPPVARPEPHPLPPPPPVAARNADDETASPPPPATAEEPMELTDLIRASRAPKTAPASQPAPAATQPASAPAGTAPAPSRVKIERPGASRPPVPREEVLSTSALQVNNRYITVEEILRSAGPALVAVPTNVSEPTYRRRVEQILQEEIRARVSQELVHEEARNRLDDDQKKHIDEEMRKTLEEMIAQAGGSRTALQTRLAAEGANLDDVLAEQRRKLTIQLYLQARFEPAISVTRKMLWDYYRAHPEKFSSEAKVQMRILAAPFSAFLPTDAANPGAAERDAARAAARKTIDAALGQLRDGKEFPAVAKQAAADIKARHEDRWDAVARDFGKVCVEKMAESGGLWGLARAGSFIEPKVEEAAFALKEGQLSDVVEGKYGFYVVQADKVQPGRTVSFEHAQAEIEPLLRREQYDKLRDDYFRRLLEGATIVHTDKFVSLAVDRAIERYYRK